MDILKLVRICVFSKNFIVPQRYFLGFYLCFVCFVVHTDGMGPIFIICVSTNIKNQTMVVVFNNVV